MLFNHDIIRVVRFEEGLWNELLLISDRSLVFDVMSSWRNFWELHLMSNTPIRVFIHGSIRSPTPELAWTGARGCARFAYSCRARSTCPTSYGTLHVVPGPWSSGARAAASLAARSPSLPPSNWGILGLFASVESEVLVRVFSSGSNFGAGIKSLSLTWSEMLIGDAHLVPVGITNRDKRAGS
jgi:hypothetical protein